MTRFFRAWKDTEASTPGIVCLDEDDAPKYRDMEVPPEWKVVIRPRYESLGANTNAYFAMYREEPWYGLLADDAVPVTRGWDWKLIEAAGSDGLACCWDGINNGTNLGSSPCIGGDWVRQMGWIIYPGLQRIYGDNILYELATKRGKLKYLQDVIVEHWHFSTGKSPMDETYRKTGSDSDLMIYESWKAAQHG